MCRSLINVNLNVHGQAPLECGGHYLRKIRKFKPNARQFYQDVSVALEEFEIIFKDTIIILTFFC